MAKTKLNDGGARTVMWSHLSVEDPASYFQDQWNSHLVGAHTGCGADLSLISKSGVAVTAHQAVILPLSTHLNLLVESSASCGCPNDSPSLLLPDWDHQTILALIQLLYSGSVVVTSEEMDKLTGLVHSLRLDIPMDRLSISMVHQSPEKSSQPPENSSPGDQEIGVEAEAAPTKQSPGDRLLSLMKDISSELVDFSNELKQEQVQDFNLSADESWRDELNISDEWKTDSNGLDDINIGSTDSETRGQNISSIHSETFSEQSEILANEKRLVMEENKALDEGNQETKDIDGTNPKTGNSCHLCHAELGFVKANVYYHYAINHFADQLFADFSQKVDGQTCQFCGEIMPNNVRRYWFLVHMGVKHKGVKRYLPPHQHIGVTKKLNPENLVVDENGNDGLEQGGQLNEKEENWKEMELCPVCSLNLSSLNLLNRSLHFYEHFKGNIKVWLDGMQEIFTHDPKACPQCKVKFVAKKSLGKHMGSVHNLYQMFIKRFRDGQLTKFNVDEKNCALSECQQIKSKVASKSKSEESILKPPKRRKRCQSSPDLNSQFIDGNDSESKK